MKFLQGMPIQRKLTAMLTLNAAIALLIGATGIALYERSRAMEDARLELETTAAMIGANSVASIIFQDARSAARTLAGLQADPRVLAASLFDAQGAEFATYGESREMGASWSGATHPAEQRMVEGDRMVLYSPIEADGERVGAILLEADMSGLQARMRAFALFVMGGIVIVTIVSLQISRKLQGVVTQPILALASAARVVRDEKRYSIRVRSTDEDEIGDLVEAFNGMLEKIENRDQYLEEQVRRRTEQLTAEKERAEEAARLKSEFLANMSHEIRTPMNVIIGMTELALDGPVEAHRRKHLQMVQRSAETLLTIINDVLDFSKIEAGKLELEPVEFDLVELVTELAQGFSVRAADKGLALDCRSDPELPRYVTGDPIRLRQVLINLVGNALKFTSSGRVELAAERVEANGEVVEVMFRVKDTGIGIPLDKQRLIFDSFAQADGSTTRRFGGTGLGLAISSRLVELMGGSLGVDSEIGRGSEFFFKAGFKLAEDRTLEYENGFDDIGAIVIDPDGDSRRLLVETLTSWGLRCAALDSVEAAIEVMRWSVRANRPFSIVLADSAAIDAEGCPLERIQAEGDLPPLPLIVLGRVASSRECEGKRTDFLMKPLSRSDLLQSLSNLLERHETPQERAAEQAVGGGGDGLDVLLAEDLPENQILAETLLTRVGHRVRIAGNGREAVEEWKRSTPDLILMDIQMPEVGGVEATGMIRELEAPSGRHTPIIALTAHAIKGDRERYLAAGMDEHVAKPIRRAELYAAIERVVRRARVPTAV
jgi:signal transduction histidine kinase/CheY-like chemotaxis protein